MPLKSNHICIDFVTVFFPKIGNISERLNKVLRDSTSGIRLPTPLDTNNQLEFACNMTLDGLFYHRPICLDPDYS